MNANQVRRPTGSGEGATRIQGGRSKHFATVATCLCTTSVGLTMADRNEEMERFGGKDRERWRAISQFVVEVAKPPCS